MKNRKRLNEGTSNFWSMNYFPLLIFADYETEDDKAREYAIGEMTEEELEDMENNYDFEYDCPRFAELVDEYYNEYADYCTLDESEVDELQDDLDSFNDSMKKKYWYQNDFWDADGAKAIDGEDWEEYGVYPSVEIKPGYYEAAQLYVNVEPKGDMIQNYKFFMQEQIDEVNAFLKEMKKKYGLSEYGVSWRASNGETGYHKIESINKISSIAKILKESPMSAEDRKDSELLNKIVAKKGKNLSKEEQDVLDRYGVDYSSGLGSFKGREYPHKLSWLPGDYNDGEPVVNDKYNVADKIRKDMSSSRDYAKDVWANGRFGDTFDKQERDYRNNRLQKDYATVSSFIGDRRNADLKAFDHDMEAKKYKASAKAYADLASTETDADRKKAYSQTATDSSVMADYHEKQRDSYLDKHRRLNKGIDDVMNKYRRKPATESAKRIPECLKKNGGKKKLKEGVMVHDQYFNDGQVSEFLDSISLSDIGMMALKWMSQDDLIEMLSANEYWIDEYFED